MPDLLLGLGAAVVKAACKLWFKDNPFAAELSGSVVDVLAGQNAGVRERRRARRLFEDIEETVADRLLSTLEHEFAGLPENERNAAVFAVTDTFERAELTNERLFASDLDALLLEHEVRASSPQATRDLDQRAVGLYDRMVADCCAYIIEITAGLPSFNQGALTEILRRETEILTGIRDLLDRIPKPDTTDAAFLTAYRRQVANTLDRLELFGVTVSESVRRYPLSVAYISLQVQTDALRPHLPMHGAEPAGAGGLVRIEQALADCNSLFVRGDAGSGKTTLLHWLAVRSARRDFGNGLMDWNDTVPFYIPLRRYVGRALPAPEGFLDQVGRNLAGEIPKGWVHQLLREGRALVLVDGIDELPENERDGARRWLRDLTTGFPNARYVVTSRPAAADEHWLDAEGFDVAELRPMTKPDIDEFVRHWHAAFREGYSDREWLDACERGLLEKIGSRRHLQALTTNPLLCAPVCALHLDRRMQIPRDRMELYNVALDLLLERRDVERLLGTDGPQLSRTDKILILQDLAYWLIRNGWSDAPVERAVERMASRLQTMQRLTDHEPDAVFRQLLVRSGLIREPVEGRFDFVHRTFQEYLAARAAIDSDDIGVLAAHAADDQWGEVIVMAAGHAQPRQRDELLHELLDRASLDDWTGRSIAVRAIACLETSPELAPNLHEQLQTLAADLVPPSRMGDADALAQAGDFILDLLADAPIKNSRQSAATIRAATKIGGPQALRVIGRCAQVSNPRVRRELMSAWPRFDADDFARDVLHRSPNARILRYEGAERILPSIRFLTELEEIHYSAGDRHHDLSFIASLPRLKRLYVYRHPGLCDISSLQEHPSLESLSLRETGVRNISVLPTIQKLTWVNLSQEINDLRPLSECQRLSSLWLNDPDLEKLGAHLPPGNLEWFGMFGTDSPPDLQRLAEIPQLHELTGLGLHNCPHPRLDTLTKWRNSLTQLSIWFCPGVETLDGLAELDGLTFFEFMGPRTDLTPLLASPGLTTINLGQADGFDLRPLSRLPALRTLTVQGRGEVDLRPLAGRPNLTVEVYGSIRTIGSKSLGQGSKVVRTR